MQNYIGEELFLNVEISKKLIDLGFPLNKCFVGVTNSGNVRHKIASNSSGASRISWEEHDDNHPLVMVQQGINFLAERDTLVTPSAMETPTMGTLYYVEAMDDNILYYDWDTVHGTIVQEVLSGKDHHTVNQYGIKIMEAMINKKFLMSYDRCLVACVEMGISILNEKINGNSLCKES